MSYVITFISTKDTLRILCFNSLCTTVITFCFRLTQQKWKQLWYILYKLTCLKNILGACIHRSRPGEKNSYIENKHLLEQIPFVYKYLRKLLKASKTTGMFVYRHVRCKMRLCTHTSMCNASITHIVERKLYIVYSLAWLTIAYGKLICVQVFYIFPDVSPQNPCSQTFQHDFTSPLMNI